jgi:hypothetical protein
LYLYITVTGGKAKEDFPYVCNLYWQGDTFERKFLERGRVKYEHDSVMVEFNGNVNPGDVLEIRGAVGDGQPGRNWYLVLPNQKLHLIGATDDRDKFKDVAAYLRRWQGAHVFFLEGAPPDLPREFLYTPRELRELDWEVLFERGQDAGFKEEVMEAAKKYLLRKARVEEPDGDRKGGSNGPWNPSDGERRICCIGIRPATWRYPDSLLVHCRTATHVAHLCGVEERDLRKAANFFQKQYVSDEVQFESLKRVFGKAKESCNT